MEFFPFELRTLQAYEAGDSSPVLEDARIMAKVYHCRIDELVDRRQRSRVGDRGFEWPRLVRRLQAWLGDTPDPESEDPKVCFIDPSQNERLAQRLGLWDL